MKSQHRCAQAATLVPILHDLMIQRVTLYNQTVFLKLLLILLQMRSACISTNKNNKNTFSFTLICIC